MERRLTLTAWEREVGIGRRTLRLWLQADVGVVFEGPQRRQRLIRQSLIEKALRAHEVKVDERILRPAPRGPVAPEAKAAEKVLQDAPREEVA